MVKYFCLYCLFLFSNLFGFNQFNNRNHSEIKWKSIKSNNVEVVYHDPLFDAAQDAMKISEATYASLVKTYDIELDKPIKIFITNQDKITNGFSVIGKYIGIWVDVNDYVEMFTGRDKWLRKVLAHEISHHFVFESISTWLDMFFPVSIFNFPSDFHEGYAMFFSGEEWGYNRSDASLRRAVFSSDMSQEHGDGFFYTTGFSMVRYLYEFYGMEKLQKLLKYRNKLKLYSFDSAFKEVYKKPLDEFKEEWRKYVFTYYYGSAYEMKSVAGDTSSSNSIEKTNCLTIKGWNKLNKISMKDSLLFFVGRNSKKQYYYDLGIGYFNQDTLLTDTLDIKRIKLIDKITSSTKLNISTNLDYLSYVKFQRRKYGSIVPILYTYQISEKKRREIGIGRNGEVCNDGSVYYQILTHEKNYIRYFNNNETKSVLSFSPKTAIGEICLSPNEELLAITKFDNEHRFLLEIYSTRDFLLQKSEELQKFPKKIQWYNDEILYVTQPMEKDSRLKICTFSLESDTWNDYQMPPYNVLPCRIEKSDSTHNAIVWIQHNRTKNKLAKINLHTTKVKQYQPNLNYYSRWIETKYPNEIVIPDTMPEFSKTKYSHIKNLQPYINAVLPDNNALSLVSLWMDPLMKNSFEMIVYYKFDDDDLYYKLFYSNKYFNPTINLSYSKYFYIGGIWEDKWFLYDAQRLSLSLSKPMDLFDNNFLGIYLFSGMDYLDVEIRDEDFDTKPVFENGSAIVANIGLDLSYHLPGKNFGVHPLETFTFSYQISMANSDLGMKKDFAKHDIETEISIAPFYRLLNSKNDVFSSINKVTYSVINGDYFDQYKPGLDMNDNLVIGGGVISNRNYLRGIEQTIVSEKLLITKNEFWMKITDDANISFNIGGPLLSLGYLGFGVWNDYGKIWMDADSKDFHTAGYEAKTVINIFGMPTVHRYGRFYDFDKENYGYYYQANLINIGF